MYTENLTLVTRNVNCSNITSDDFVRMMMEDLKTAVKNHYDYYYPRAVNIMEENRKKFLANENARIVNAAYKKYKSEKWAKKFIDKEYAKAYEKYKMYKPNYMPVTFFDMDLEPGSNGINDLCILQTNTDEDRLRRCFELIKDNKYFKDALGWELVCRPHSRSYVNLMLSDEMKKIYETEAKRLADAIDNFYRGCTYWGD